MKKLSKPLIIIISLSILLFSVWLYRDANALVILGGHYGGAAAYCDTQTWNTLTSFRLDFDNTDGNHIACLAVGTELLTDVATPIIEAVPYAMTGASGGNCIKFNSNDENILGDNTNSYFNSAYGEVYFLVILAGNNADNYYFFYPQAVVGEDRLRFEIAPTGVTYILWEDHNGDTDQIDIVDLDSYYNKWVQFHIVWDTTECTAGDGNCGAVNEVGARWRADANGDGDFEDGGVENWSAYCYISSTDDFEAWVSEPGADEIIIGLNPATYDVDVWMDDIEISSAKPVGGLGN